MITVLFWGVTRWYHVIIYLYIERYIERKKGKEREREREREGTLASSSFGAALVALWQPARSHAVAAAAGINGAFGAPTGRSSINEL